MSCHLHFTCEIRISHAAVPSEPLCTCFVGSGAAELPRDGGGRHLSARPDGAAHVPRARPRARHRPGHLVERQRRPQRVPDPAGR